MHLNARTMKRRLIRVTFCFVLSLHTSLSTLWPLDVADLPSTARPKYVVAVEPASTAGLEASRELLATKYQVVLKRMQLWRPQEHLWEGHSGMSGGLFAKDVAILVDKVPYLSFCYGRAAAEPATCKVSVES